MRFNIYIFAARTHATLTSLIIFGGKKMQCSRRERCFCSPGKVIRVKEVYLDHTKKVTEKVAVFRFYFFVFAFYFLVFCL